MTIDVWMQHPTARFLASEFLASLRRWTGGQIPEGELPIESTLESMDVAGVDIGLLSAWRGPTARTWCPTTRSPSGFAGIRRGSRGWPPWISTDR